MKHFLVIASLALLASVSHHAAAQQLPPGVKAVPLSKADVAGADVKEVVVLHVEIGPGVSLPKHFHNGQEFFYVQEGTAVTMTDGQPTRELKAGDLVQRPYKVAHDMRNTGSGPLRGIAFFVVDKGQPLTVTVGQ